MQRLSPLPLCFAYESLKVSLRDFTTLPVLSFTCRQRRFRSGPRLFVLRAHRGVDYECQTFDKLKRNTRVMKRARKESAA